MYVPNHFAMTPAEVGQLLAGVGAADLVTAHDHGLVATFLPFVFDPDPGEHGSLITHVARNNRQWCDPVVGEAMVIVHGAEHYVSPRWQPSFAEHGQVVPTWNYVTVHAYGRLVAHDDPAWAEAVVRRLTALHEAHEGHEGHEGHEEGYSLDRLPADFVERQLRAVVGIEVQLTRVEAKAKMSQNRTPSDVEGIIDGLRTRAGDDQAIRTAEWMAQNAVPAARHRAEVLAEVARAHRR